MVLVNIGKSRETYVRCNSSVKDKFISCFTLKCLCVKCDPYWCVLADKHGNQYDWLVSQGRVIEVKEVETICK